MKKYNNGFTLIELLAVILILGIIALIAIPVVNKIITQARKGATIQTGNNIIKATESHYNICLINSKSNELCDINYAEEVNLASLIGIKGKMPDEINYLKVVDGNAEIIYRDGKYSCSNLLDENNNVIFDENDKKYINKTINCIINDEDINIITNEYLIEHAGLWNNSLDNNEYRYIGTNPNNYICFGTSNKNTCKNNIEEYMYRIIGIFKGSDNQYHLKLIKKEALSTLYKWNDNGTDVSWESSTLCSNLNGDIYLNNNTYMPNNWSDKIELWTWNLDNTLTYTGSGPNFYYSTAAQTYLHEMNKSGKPSGGNFTTTQKKIGLIYASDHLLALGSEALAYTSSSNYNQLYTGWTHLFHNDPNHTEVWEWTISRTGKHNSNYDGWFINMAGGISNNSITSENAVRPTFYLKSNCVITSGAGSIDNPYIIKFN